jgi:hypothetical protein
MMDDRKVQSQERVAVGRILGCGEMIERCVVMVEVEGSQLVVGFEECLSLSQPARESGLLQAKPLLWGLFEPAKRLCHAPNNALLTKLAADHLSHPVLRAFNQTPE